MAPRFSRPRLLSVDDRQYRAFLAQIMLGKDNQRPTRPPRARELFGSEAEAALRDWLSQQCNLSERRILEYFEHRGRSAVKKYRELDAVELAGKTVHVFEIKASQKATSLRRALRQLHDTRALLSMLFAHVSTTIMLVDTGIPTAEEVTALMSGPEPPPIPPPTLDDMLAALPQIHLIKTLDERDTNPDVVNLLRFSVDDIIAMVGAEHLHLDWEEPEEEPLQEPVENLTTPYATFTADQTANDQDEDEGSLGAALRQAFQGRKGNDRD